MGSTVGGETRPGGEAKASGLAPAAPGAQPGPPGVACAEPPAALCGAKGVSLCGGPPGRGHVWVVCTCSSLAGGLHPPGAAQQPVHCRLLRRKRPAPPSPPAVFRALRVGGGVVGASHSILGAVEGSPRRQGALQVVGAGAALQAAAQRRTTPPAVAAPHLPPAPHRRAHLAQCALLRLEHLRAWCGVLWCVCVCVEGAGMHVGTPY